MVWTTKIRISMNIIVIWIDAIFGIFKPNGLNPHFNFQRIQKTHKFNLNKLPQRLVPVGRFLWGRLGLRGPWLGCCWRRGLHGLGPRVNRSGRRGGMCRRPGGGHRSRGWVDEARDARGSTHQLPLVLQLAESVSANTIKCIQLHNFFCQ